MASIFPVHDRSTLHVSASRTVAAPAATVYHVLADYRVGHTRIVPPKYFRNLRVEEGGVGEGTIIAFDLLAPGRVIPCRARVTEPEKGRKLVETDLETGAETTFLVERRDAASCTVTISTRMAVQRAGLLGAAERALTRAFLRRVYVSELDRIEVAALATIMIAGAATI